ncbi:hypothetical protein [Halobacillus litoralis]|nr:hypothetical protein [Halobacillus litoralis]
MPAETREVLLSGKKARMPTVKMAAIVRKKSIAKRIPMDHLGF